MCGLSDAGGGRGAGSAADIGVYNFDSRENQAEGQRCSVENGHLRSTVRASTTNKLKSSPAYAYVSSENEGVVNVYKSMYFFARHA